MAGSAAPAGDGEDAGIGGGDGLRVCLVGLWLIRKQLWGGGCEKVAVGCVL